MLKCSVLWQKQRQIVLISLPMVLSNLCVPLLGLVDTAVVGHLPEPHYLGGVTLGGSIISLLYFLLGFLRMSTTGLTAQAYGRGGDAATVPGLQQGILLALLLSALLLLLQWPVITLSFYFSDASTAVLQQTKRPDLERPGNTGQFSVDGLVSGPAKCPCTYVAIAVW